MGEIFLSASIPVVGRGRFHEDADPFLIQFAVRELLAVALGRRTIVWGGHPAITPMVWSVCTDLGVDYSRAVVLYQSNFFKEYFPEENKKFANVVYVEAVDGDKEASLLSMRKQMLDRKFEAAVFIGGMEGVLEEFELFRQLHPAARVAPIGVAGGAAKILAERMSMETSRIDFARFFSETLDIDPTQPRHKV